MNTPKLIAIFLAVFAITSHAATYVITGSGSSFTATKNGATVGTANQTIDDVINDIRTDAAQADCTIQFGDGESVLDIGGRMIIFVDYGWGTIALRGKITSEYSTYLSSTIQNSASITSTADISITGNNGRAVDNQTGGTVTISGGTVSASGGSGVAVYNNSTGAVTISNGTISATGSYGVAVENNSTGTVTISGGTISATNSSGGVAVRNRSTGKITVSGTAIVTSANTTATSGTIVIINSGSATAERLEIKGGTVGNTAASANARAIYNASTGAVTISGGTVSAANGTAVYNNSTGTIIGNGGTVTGSQKYFNNSTGTIIAWDNQPAGSKTYTAFTDDDIIKYPTTATVQWLNKNGAGIDYTDGATTDFVAVSGVVVNKATPTVTWPTSTPINYGAALSTSALSSGVGAGTFAWTNGSTIPTVTNGGYSVTFTPTDAENYNTITHNVAITVNKVKIAKPTVTNTSLVYNGNEQTAGIATNAAYTITNGSAKNAGNYTATVALNDKANNEWADNTDTDLLLPWKIERATGLENDAPPLLKISTSNTNIHTYSLSTIALNKLDHGTLSYELGEYNPGDNILASPPTLDEETLLLSYKGVGKKSGNATQKIIVTSQNYTDITVTITFEAIDRIEVDIIGITAQNSVYDGTPKSGYTGTATSGAYTGELIYEYAGTEHPQSTTPPTNVGEYTLRVTVPYDTPYTGEWRGTFTIAKAKIAKPTASTNLVYTGSEQSAGIAENEAYTVTSGSATNAGSYTATVALKDIANYEWADNTTEDLTLSWSIAKATAATPTGVTATAGQTLADITLPAGWEWADATTSVGTV